MQSVINERRILTVIINSLYQTKSLFLVSFLDRKDNGFLFEVKQQENRLDEADDYGESKDESPQERIYV